MLGLQRRPTAERKIESRPPTLAQERFVEDLIQILFSRSRRKYNFSEVESCPDLRLWRVRIQLSAPMSLHLQEPPSVPEETSRVAQAAFPKGNLCLHIAAMLGPIYKDDQFAALFPRRGQPAEAPGLLALVTVLQYVEGLSDRQAADAVRGRIDWKYALGLSLIDPGFDHTVLSEFRSRLVEGKAEQLLLDTLLKCLREHDLV
jgi:transposase